MSTPPFSLQGTPIIWADIDFGPSIGKVRRPINNERTVTAAGDITVLPYDYVIYVNKTVPAVTNVQLPDLNIWMRGQTGGFPLIIKDAANNALEYPITILPFGAQTIDGGDSYSIAVNGGVVILKPEADASGWSVITPEVVSFIGTSATSVAIGSGSKAFVTQSRRAFAIGMDVRITSGAAPLVDYMYGTVTAYDEDTGDLTVDVYTYSGSGSHTDWTIGISGARGATGSAGAAGASRAITVTTLALLPVGVGVLANGVSVGGVTVATGQVVCLAGEDDPAENGIYDVGASAGTSARNADFDTFDAHCGVLIAVADGDQTTIVYRGTAAPGGVLDTTPITFEDIRLVDLVPDDEYTRGATLLRDTAEYAQVIWDPATGRAKLSGRDAMPGIVEIWPWYGQSNAGGEVDARKPAIILAKKLPGRAFMFEAAGLIGLGTTDLSTLVDPYRFKLVSLQEETYQTHISAFAIQLAALDDAAGRPSPVRIFVNCSRNGAQYVNLAQGTTPYDNVLHAVTALKNRYQNVMVMPIIVIHGEADAANSVTQVEYHADLVEWQSDFDTDLRAITGQTMPVAMMHVQLPMLISNPNAAPIQDAQVQCYLEYLSDPDNNPPILVTGARHQHQYGDNTHESPYWVAVNAAEIATELYNWLNGDPLSTIYAISATLSGDDILVTTNYTGSALVLDETFLPEQPSKGVLVLDGITPVDVTAVTPVDTNKFQLTLASPGGAGFTVENARVPSDGSGGGGRSGIRGADQIGTVAALPDNIPIYPWLLANSVTVA